MTTLKIPEFALVVLIGASGSGKSTFARKHFLSDAIFTISHQIDIESLDDRFNILIQDIARRLQTLQTVVVDAPFYFKKHRALMSDVAAKYGAHPFFIVFHISITTLRHLPEFDDLFSVKETINHMKALLETIDRHEFFAQVLNGTDAIESSRVETDTDVFIDWTHTLSERYQDYGRPSTEPAYLDYDSIQLDLEYAAGLVYERKASDDIIRTSLPHLLAQVRYLDEDMWEYIVDSSKRWQLDEQTWFKMYCISLWFSILRRSGAFDQWDWSLPAASFIQVIDNPDPYLAVWKRHLKSQQKPAVFQLVNTLLEHFEYSAKFWHWLQQPFIQQTLEQAFFQYEGTKFGERISAAENKLRKMKKQS